MPRPCSVCTHPNRAALDHALVSGTPIRESSALFRVSEDAITRHKATHLPAALVKAEAAREIAHADHLLREAGTLYTTATAIMAEARAAGDSELALKAITAAGRMLALLGELLGELNRQPRINILVSPEWLTVRAALFDALAHYPDARTAVAGRLAALEVEAG